MSDERRRHRVFFTKHTEYHLRDAECVGVRDRGSGAWVVDHAALRSRALSIPGPWDVGQRIHFWGRRTDVLTSPVVAVGRPRIEEVVDYVSQARSGFIADNPSSALESSLPACL